MSNIYPGKVKYINDKLNIFCNIANNNYSHVDSIRHYIQKRLRDLIDNYEIYDYIIHNSELNKNIKIDYKISKSTEIVVFNYQHIKEVRKDKLKLLLK